MIKGSLTKTRLIRLATVSRRSGDASVLLSLRGYERGYTDSAISDKGCFSYGLRLLHEVGQCYVSMLMVAVLMTILVNL